jgi:fido (protein-threonine AMPylation protein)
MSTVETIRADERRKCAQELRDYAQVLTSEAVAHITAGEERHKEDLKLSGLAEIHRAAAIDSAARLLEGGAA